MTSCDVLVVAYHNATDLDTFLVSYAKNLTSTDLDQRLYVAVNDPSQDDYDVIAKWKKLDFDLSLNENIGYARSVNKLAAKGEGDVIGIFNADTRIPMRGMDACVNALWEVPEWMILGPRQVSSRGKITAGGIIGERDSPAHRGFGAEDRGQYQDLLTEVPMVVGSVLFTKRQQVWEALTRCPTFQEISPGAEGAFLPTPHFYEETFFCNHALQHADRGKCVYYGLVTFIHEQGSSTPTGSASSLAKASREIYRSACIKHGMPTE